MLASTAHSLADSIMWVILGLIVLMSVFAIKDPGILPVMLGAALGETVLTAIIQYYWVALALVILYLYALVLFILDSDRRANLTDPAKYLPTWMRNTPEQGSTLIQLEAPTSVLRRPSGAHRPEEVALRTGTYPTVRAS